MLMTQHQSVVQAFGPNRPAPLFCDSVRLWRLHWGPNPGDAERSQAPVERDAIATVAIMYPGGEEITSPDLLGMLLQKLSPAG
jgi:hypothetical protein